MERQTLLCVCVIIRSKRAARTLIIIITISSFWAWSPGQMSAYRKAPHTHNQLTNSMADPLLLVRLIIDPSKAMSVHQPARPHRNSWMYKFTSGTRQKQERFQVALTHSVHAGSIHVAFWKFNYLSSCPPPVFLSQCLCAPLSFSLYLEAITLSLTNDARSVRIKTSSLQDFEMIWKIK